MGDEDKRAQEKALFTPAVDIYETGYGMVLLADMPGVSKGGVEISVEREGLTIRGHIDESEESGRKLYSEFRSGDYYREFRLGSEIDTEKIEAKIKDGVLTLTLPKAESAKPRKIEVKGE